MPKFYSRQQLDFVLFKVHKVQTLLQFEKYSDHTLETMEMVLDSAHSLSEKRLYPIHMEMDVNEPELKDDKIFVHPHMKSICKEFGDQGWISATSSFEDGGQQLPHCIAESASFIFGAANYSASVFYGLTHGACELIKHYGSKEQQEQFIPKMFDGSWQGTMALTEPEAGSSLSDLNTKATPTTDEHYMIKGQKIFISCGDHDACDNVIHMMLARVEGAPAGTKGISMFIVPQKRMTQSGELEYNDVLTAGLYHKLGYRGAPIAHIMTGENDDCRGYLVGEENKGLTYMFKMMNGARIMVGMHAVSIASAAYYSSLAYARERKQGRNIAKKDMSLPQVPIVEHADVKRMLLFQKSVIEGSLSLLVQCSLYQDLAEVAGEAEQEKYALLLDLLTPIAKSYPSEMGILTTSAAIQIHGGYGYTREYDVEKYFRDMRIHTIHEGTTAIHGLDLMGRKIAQKNGQALMFLLQEIMADLALARQYESLNKQTDQLSAKLLALQELTVSLGGVAQEEGYEAYLSDATLYLELFSIIAVAWQWLKMSTTALEQMQAANESEKAFLKSCLLTGQFYFEYELVKTTGLVERLRSKERITLLSEQSLFL